MSLIITYSRPSEGVSVVLTVSLLLKSLFGLIVIAVWFARNRLMMKNMIGMTEDDFVLE